MHSGPQECRENALRCTELAETTQSPAQAQLFSNLAKQWMKLAVELEHAGKSAEQPPPRSKEAIGRLSWPPQRGSVDCVIPRW
jgi:hypothetical protein